MKDAKGVQFLQWVLPRLHMRWQGFRKVRRQVCRRIDRRIRELGLVDTKAYRVYLEKNKSEWMLLDHLCRVTISRFYRDRGVFDFLGNEVLPSLIKSAKSRGETMIRCLCTGCASGEEPYSISLLWNFSVLPAFPDMDLRITATDTDRILLERAREACYPASSLKELPEEWLFSGFSQKENCYRLLKEFRGRVNFLEQDVRGEVATGLFHIVLCRNLVFTYFEEELQLEILERIRGSLHEGGALVLGTHESLPKGASGFHPWKENFPVFRKEMA